MPADPQKKRRLFLFAHAVVRTIRQVGDDYRATFALALRQRVSLMSQFSSILRDSEAVLQRRLQWLRRRKLLAPRPKPIAFRERADMFAVNPESLVPT